MKIRNLTKEDVIKNINSIISLGNDIIPREIQYWDAENYLLDTPDKWKYSVGCFGDGNIIGFIICTNKNGVIHINKMAINGEYRGKNIGTKMIGFLINICKNNGINKITLYTNTLNVLAKNFYLKNGFVVDTVLKNKETEKYLMFLNLNHD